MIIYELRYGETEGQPRRSLVWKKIVADKGKECFTLSYYVESFIHRIHVLFQRVFEENNDICLIREKIDIL